MVAAGSGGRDPDLAGSAGLVGAGAGAFAGPVGLEAVAVRGVERASATAGSTPAAAARVRPARGSAARIRRDRSATTEAAAGSTEDLIPGGLGSPVRDPADRDPEDHDVAARASSARARVARVKADLARSVHRPSRGSRDRRRRCATSSRSNMTSSPRVGHGWIDPPAAPVAAVGHRGDGPTSSRRRSAPAPLRRRSRKTRSSLPAGAPSRRRSPPAARPDACSSPRSVARRSRRSCFMPPRCGSRSSRWKAGR